MAEAGFNQSPFVLPNMFAPPGQALENTLRRDERQAERQYDIDFRNQRIKEADDWRKLQLIQELTNLDKYQTGEQTADAIGYNKSQELLQKYTALAGGMSPAELQYKISQDIQKTSAGLQSMKDELVMSDAAIKQIKTLYPSLDSQALTKEHRKEIINRRIEGGNEFANPLKANEPSTFKLDDPDFLSYFIKDSKALTDSIRNPKYSEDVTVGMGSPSSYTTQKGKLPFFRKLNYDPKADVKDGFLKKKIQPSMDIIGTTEKFRGNQIEVLGDEPFELLDESNRLELAREARQKFPDYDLMTKEEKRTARKSAAFDSIKSTDRSGFDFGTATKPPSIRVSTGGSGTSDAAINDLYKRMGDTVQKFKDYGEKKIPVSLLDSDAQTLALDFAKKAKGEDYTNTDIWIEEAGGNLNLWDKDRNLIGTLPKVGTNLKVQPGVKEKREVIQQSNKKTYQGLDPQGNPIYK